MTNRLERLERLLNAGFVSAGFFFFSWLVCSYVFGGTACEGHVENGQYLLSERGALTAVSPIVWYVNLLLGIVAPVLILSTLFLGLIAGDERYRREGKKRAAERDRKIAARPPSDPKP